MPTLTVGYEGKRIVNLDKKSGFDFEYKWEVIQ